MNDLPDDEVSPGLRRIIGDALAAAGGWLGFDAFMARALYAPGLGYYARDSLKFGSLPYRQQDGRAVAGSDFVTAPEISPLLARPWPANWPRPCTRPRPTPCGSLAPAPVPWRSNC